MKKNISYIMILSLLILTSCSSGQSKDIIYSVDRGLIHNHLYLKDDHSSCYCFTDENLYNKLKIAQTENKKVIVEYEDDYFSLCYCGDKFDEVKITNVIFTNE